MLHPLILNLVQNYPRLTVKTVSQTGSVVEKSQSLSQVIPPFMHSSPTVPPFIWTYSHLSPAFTLGGDCCSTVTLEGVRRPLSTPSPLEHVALGGVFLICRVKPGSSCLSVGSSGQLGRDKIPDDTEARQEDDTVLHLPVDSVLDPPGRPT